MNARLFIIALSVTCVAGGAATNGQTSSVGARQRQVEKESPTPEPPRESPKVRRNLVYERYSWTSSPRILPKTFKVNDLITIIVRERLKYEADAELETTRKFNLKSELDAFIKPTQGGIGSTTFLRGKPNIDYKFDTKRTSEADTSREDKLTTRITAKILDVKPNGTLVLEATGTVIFDDEESRFTLTGICRKEDVAPDNTVLSTQLADKVVVVNNKGALHAAARRGFLSRLLDLLNPF